MQRYYRPIANTMIILLNDEHHSSVPADELIDTLVYMMEQKIYVPSRDIIEILSEQDWLDRRPLPRPRL